MTIVFYARYLTHHLTPFCEKLLELTNNNFWFVETETIPEETIALGYEDLKKKQYVVDAKTMKEKALSLSIECDVAIIGCGAYEFMDYRLHNTNKLTFKLKERLFKEGVNKRFESKIKNEMFKKHQKYKNKNVFYLCAGTFTAVDFHYLHLDHNKFFKWGYYPPFEKTTPKNYGNKSQTEIIWVGRFIDDKKPFIAINALKILLNKGYNVKLSFLGNGELYPKMVKRIKELNLTQNVIFYGSVSHELVKEYMRRADIFLMTSDYREGWGAVLNEAMSVGTICVSSLFAGATHFLIQDGVNGFTYYKSAVNAVKSIEKVLKCKNKNLISKNSIFTIEHIWNGITAAERFYSICNKILSDGMFDFYDDGPMSKASIICTAKEIAKDDNYR